MDIKPIFLSLKQNKFLAILMVIQIAFTMGVLSSSVLVATGTLRDWGMPSGIPHEDIIRISPEFFDETQNIGQALVKDIERANIILKVTDSLYQSLTKQQSESAFKLFFSVP